jgi:hypothetical protein
MDYDLASIESKCTKMTANNAAKVASSQIFFVFLLGAAPSLDFPLSLLQILSSVFPSPPARTSILTHPGLP